MKYSGSRQLFVENGNYIEIVEPPFFLLASTSIRLRQMAPRRWSVRLSLIGRWTRLN